MLVVIPLIRLATLLFKVARLLNTVAMLGRCLGPKIELPPWVLLGRDLGVYKRGLLFWESFWGEGSVSAIGPLSAGNSYSSASSITMFEFAFLSVKKGRRTDKMSSNWQGFFLAVDCPLFVCLALIAFWKLSLKQVHLFQHSWSVKKIVTKTVCRSMFRQIFHFRLRLAITHHLVFIQWGL